LKISISNIRERYWSWCSHQSFQKNNRVDGEIVEVDIINLFGFTLWDTILELGENFVQDHPNCTFEELEQTFSNYEEQQKSLYVVEEPLTTSWWTGKGLLWAFVNCLQVKATNVFLTIIFRVGLQPYLRLAIVGMTRNTLIKH
jgi:hypothetical protein